MLSTTILALLSVSSGSHLPRGDYVEARTAAVYAGACHFGSERTTRGRAAVLGLRIHSGSWDGIDLSGVQVAAAIAAPANLADTGAARESIVYLGDDLASAQREAALSWLAAEHPGTLGRVRAVRALPLEVAVEGDVFRLTAGDVFTLAGRTLAERECCKMPYLVWYEPLLASAERLVGRADLFRADVPELGRRFSSGGENCAFVGRFGEGR